MFRMLLAFAVLLSAGAVAARVKEAPAPGTAGEAASSVVRPAPPPLRADGTKTRVIVIPVRD
jgi:hypothetical protein